MEKGQAAIEFIFIILIIVVYLFTTSLPLIENAKGIIEDVENVSKTNFECEKIINVSNKLVLLGTNSKETLNIIIPKNSKIICQTNNLSFESKINQTGSNPKISLCKNNICDKNFNLINNFDFNCSFNQLDKGIYKIILTKIDDDTIRLSD